MLKEPVAGTRALEEVRRIVMDVLDGGKVTVYLFGSWARGEATPLSDIDVAIEPHTALPPGTLAGLRERLEESHVPYRVDVVDLRRATPAFRRRVLAEGIQWNDYKNGLPLHGVTWAPCRNCCSLHLPHEWSGMPPFNALNTPAKPSGRQPSAIS